MVKSGNQITTNLLMEKPTAEKNGVEVTIKNISNFKPYNKALQYIVFFPNIYIDGASDAAIINSAKLKRFKNFAAAFMDKPVPSKLLLGNVLYKCDKYHLSYDVQQFLNNIENTGIVVKFDVGEINITPNRENIIYSADTIKKIEDRILSAKKELEELIGAKITKDYDNIDDYYNAIDDVKYYDPVTDTITSIYGGYRFEPIHMETCVITYKGVDIRNNKYSIRNLLSLTLPNYRGVISDEKIYIKKLPHYVRYNNQIKSKKILMLNEGARFLTTVKLYIKDKYDGYGVMIGITEEDFRKYIEYELGSLSLPKDDNYDLIVSGVYESLMNKAVRLDIETDKDYLSFKENISAKRIAGALKEREVILYEYDSSKYRNRLSFSRLSQALSYIKSLKKGIILTNMDANDSMFTTLARLKGFTFIKARKDIVSDLRSLNLSCIVDNEWLLKKDPMLTVVNTIAKHFPDGMIDKYDIDTIGENIPKDLYNEFIRIYKIYKDYKQNIFYYSIVKDGNFGIDPYTEYLCLKLRYYHKKHEEVKTLIINSGFICNSTITTAAVMKSKAYRISGKAYNRLKNNKLISVLCRKS